MKHARFSGYRTDASSPSLNLTSALAIGGLLALSVSAQAAPPTPTFDQRSHNAVPTNRMVDPGYLLRVLDDDIEGFMAAFERHTHPHAVSLAGYQDVTVDLWPSAGDSAAQAFVDLFTAGEGRNNGLVVRDQQRVFYLGFDGAVIGAKAQSSPPCNHSFKRPRRVAPVCKPLGRHG